MLFCKTIAFVRVFQLLESAKLGPRSGKRGVGIIETESNVYLSKVFGTIKK